MTKRICTRTCCTRTVTALMAATAALPVYAQSSLLQDGTFDNLLPGTAPDCGNPAGAWGWPVEYVAAGVCEQHPQQITIVPTDSFSLGEAGNSLALDVDSGTVHLTNIFPAVHARPGHLLVVEFDLWVVQPSPGFGGGHIYLGSGGYIYRGPHIGWWNDGTITTPVGGCPTCCPVMLPDPQNPLSYPFGAWQSLRLIVDLNPQTAGGQSFDVWWSLRGTAPVKIGSERPFFTTMGSSLPAEVTWIDRFTVARFGEGPVCAPSPPVEGARSYLDNIRIYEARDCNANRIPDNLECYANCDASTTPPVLNVEDFSCFINLFASAQSLPHGQQLAHCANCDASTAPPVLNVEDFSCFINAFAAGCP
jgi:hypothetical protein